ncbi:MAG: SPOR domain-containing protein [Rhodocyclaceae bacterium]|nr:SPOR domain-containing protein [Rhodocyclaceae bacterium]
MTDSDNIDLQKRSRRRLVGAAALTLLAAIVLPMVMDDEPGLPVNEIQVTIPDRHADAALSRPIAGRTPAAGEPAITPAPMEPAVAWSDTEIIDDDAIVLDDNVATVLPTPAEAPPSRPATSTLPVPGTPPAAGGTEPARPAPKPSPEDEAERVKAILEGRLASVGTNIPTTSSEGRFVVQVGAFGDGAKARSLSSDLNRRGFKSYTESAGPVTRVRVGPFASRDDAEKAAGQLRSLSMSAVVTTR